MNSTQGLLGIENRSNMITFHLALPISPRNDRITTDFRIFQQFYIISAIKPSIRLRYNNGEKKIIK